MKRKDFLKKGLASGTLIGSSMMVSGLNNNDSDQKQGVKSNNDTKVRGDPEELVIERSVWVERFHYINSDSPNMMEKYIRENAISG